MEGSEEAVGAAEGDGTLFGAGRDVTATWGTLTRGAVGAAVAADGGGAVGTTSDGSGSWALTSRDGALVVVDVVGSDGKTATGVAAATPAEPAATPAERAPR
jgi:hypothetical protein